MAKFKNIFSRNSKNKKSEANRIAMFNALSTGQRVSTGSREEMCSGTMNNNQKLATLQLLRDMKDD